MKEKYQVDQFGVVHQISYEPFDYNQAYQDAYKNLNEEGMSHLRLGFLIGSIGRIPKSLIDVGPGSGHFATTASKIIHEVYVSDVNPREDINLPFITEPFKQPVDVITMFDVMEHIPDLSFVRDIQAKYLLISLPCFPGMDKFENWKHRKPNEHLHHFDQYSLRMFMADCGWYCDNVINIEDMIRISDDYRPNIITALFKRI